MGTKIRRRTWWIAGLLAAVLLVLLWVLTRPSKDDPVPIGIETAALIVFDGPRLVPAPYKDGAPLVARIAGSTTRGPATVYDVRYIVNRPGTFDLRNYFRAADGSALDALPSFEITADRVGGDPIDGALDPVAQVDVDIPGGYFTALAGIGAAWIIWLLLLIFYKRERRTAPVEEAPPEPTLRELLLPLVRLAEEGKLDLAHKSELDLLLLKYWRDELNLTPGTVAAGIDLIRRDANTGDVFETIERWLHSRHEVRTEVVTGMLRACCGDDTPREPSP